MKVVDKRCKDFKCKLSDLVISTTFVYEDELYMVLAFKIDYVKVVSLETGQQTNFIGNRLVTPVYVECNIIRGIEIEH